MLFLPVKDRAISGVRVSLELPSCVAGLSTTRLSQECTLCSGRPKPVVISDVISAEVLKHGGPGCH